VAEIGHPCALMGAFAPVAEGVNSLKMEFIDVVARFKSGPTELSYAVDQGGQASIDRWLYTLSLDEQREQKFILP
jgi:hypothetical protein